MALSRRTIRIVSLAVGIPVLVIALAILALTWLLGGFRDNVAKDALAPMTQQLAASGATQICDEGDAGYGPDNTQPWYKTFYAVPDAKAGRAAFFTAAALNGYALRPDTTVPGQSAHQQFWASSPDDLQPGLTLVIHRDVTVTFDCPSNDNGTQRTSGAGAIYEIEFASPGR